MVRIVEVGPRDGLQNEAVPIPTEEKVEFCRALASAGIREIEATSFVSPKWVPQLADAEDVLTRLPEVGPVYWVLVPNLKGLERVRATGVRHIALFTAASDAFTQRNIRRTVDESLAEFAEILEQFRGMGPGKVRGYVSTAIECPFAGRILPAQTAKVVGRLFELGVDEVALGDTIGVAVPAEVRALARELGEFPRERIAWHFHDTRGTAVGNVAAALELGYRTFDASAGGLGGCPYAPGAGGNLATEDLVYFLERSGEPTGVDLVKLAQASLPILERLGRRPSAKVQRVVLAAAG